MPHVVLELRLTSEDRRMERRYHTDCTTVHELQRLEQVLALSQTSAMASSAGGAAAAAAAAASVPRLQLRIAEVAAATGELAEACTLAAAAQAAYASLGDAAGQVITAFGHPGVLYSWPHRHCGTGLEGKLLRDFAHPRASKAID